jgi:2-amino-4-hydroxy-6-hydroxymethyldihydropteridine diphosphokinase
MTRVFVGVGSNIAPERNVREAVRLLAAEVHVVAVSTAYRTAPLGRVGQPEFYNCVVQIETGMSPARLRSALRRIEGKLGRKRGDDKCAPRTIDLDVLIYGDLAVTTDAFVIPDPQIAERPFLALPLRELAPDLVLPGSGRPIREIAAELGGRDMQPLPEYTEVLRREVANGQREDRALGR